MKRKRQKPWSFSYGWWRVSCAFLFVIFCETSAQNNGTNNFACFCDHCDRKSSSTTTFTEISEFSSKDVTCELNSSKEDDGPACFVFVKHTSATEQALRNLLAQIPNMSAFLQQLDSGTNPVDVSHEDAMVQNIHLLLNYSISEHASIHLGCTVDAFQCRRLAVKGESFKCCKTPYCNLELLKQVYDEIDLQSLTNTNDQSTQHSSLAIVIVVCAVGSVILVTAVGVTLHLRNQRLLLRFQDSVCADGSTQQTMNVTTDGYLPLTVRSSSSSAGNLHRVTLNRAHRRTASQRTSHTTLVGSTSISGMQSFSTMRDDVASPSVATSWLPATSLDRTAHNSGRLEPRTCARDLVFVDLLKAGLNTAHQETPVGEESDASAGREHSSWSERALLIVPSDSEAHRDPMQHSMATELERTRLNDSAAPTDQSNVNQESTENFDAGTTAATNDTTVLASQLEQTGEHQKETAALEAILDGSVWLGRYRDSLTAVKLYAAGTFGEARWRHAADLLQLTLVRHDNVIGFVGADCAPPPLPTPTRLARPFCMLLTEYHRLGSLRDFLVHVYASASCASAPQAMNTRTLVSFAHSLACGLSYLHTDMNGTRGKPALAHCSLKATHVYVKADLTLCIGGFDRAVRYVSNRLEVPAFLRCTIDARVPTVAALYGLPCTDSRSLERACSPVSTTSSLNESSSASRRVLYDDAVLYCAPEILADRLARNDFEAYRRADMYAFSVLLCEIAQAYATANYTTLLASAGQDASASVQEPDKARTAYRPPFVDELCTRKTERDRDSRISRFEEADVNALRELVVDRRYRPPISDALQVAAKHDEFLNSLMDTIAYCWLDDPQARLTSLRVKKSLLVELPFGAAQAGQPASSNIRS